MHPIPLNRVQSPKDAHNSMLKQAMENRNEARSARHGGGAQGANNFSQEAQQMSAATKLRQSSQPRVMLPQQAQTELNLKQSGIDPLTLYSMKTDSNEVSNVA